MTPSEEVLEKHIDQDYNLRSIVNWKIPPDDTIWMSFQSEAEIC